VSSRPRVTPRASSRRFARRVLEIRDELPQSKRAMTPKGLDQARKIAAGEQLDALEVCNWFRRHKRNIELGESRYGDAGELAVRESKAVQASWGWGHWPLYLDACAAVFEWRQP